MMRLRPPRAQGWTALFGVAVIVLSSGLIEAGPVQKRSPGDDMKDDVGRIFCTSYVLPS